VSKRRAICAIAGGGIFVALGMVIMPAETVPRTFVHGGQFGVIGTLLGLWFGRFFDEREQEREQGEALRNPLSIRRSRGRYLNEKYQFSFATPRQWERRPLVTEFVATGGQVATAHRRRRRLFNATFDVSVGTLDRPEGHDKVVRAAAICEFLKGNPQHQEISVKHFRRSRWRA
jgi:hypothetical protein